MLGFTLPSLVAKGRSAAEGEFAPNAFIRIGQDGRVGVIVPQVEMGQGTFTSCPMLVAEELEIDLAQVEVEQAPPSDKLYTNPLVGFQVTGGSTSIRAFYKPLREAGAIARTMLIAAAAETWGVDPEHVPRRERERGPRRNRAKARLWRARRQGRDLAGAGKMSRSRTRRTSRSSARRRSVSTPRKDKRQRRLRHRCQDSGHEGRHGRRLPVFGGKLKSVTTDSAALIKDVYQVVRLDNAVAVIAAHMGAAKKDSAALEIEWDEGPNAKLTTADIVALMAKASESQGVLVRDDGDVDGGLAKAATKLDAIYEVPFLAHTTMEPINCTVHVRKDSARSGAPRN